MAALGAGLALLLFGALFAGAAEESIAPTAGETHITSRSVDFDLKTRQAIYRGEVTVLDPRIQLTCELLTATLAESGGRVDSLVAESNVVATIATNDTVFTVKSSKAIYTYQLLGSLTNQTLELTGPPEPTITWPQKDSEPPRTNEFTARSILWDIGRGKINAEGHRGVFPNVDALKKVTESAPTTNAPAAPVSPNP